MCLVHTSELRFGQHSPTKSLECCGIRLSFVIFSRNSSCNSAVTLVLSRAPASPRAAVQTHCNDALDGDTRWLKRTVSARFSDTSLSAQLKIVRRQWLVASRGGSLRRVGSAIQASLHLSAHEPRYDVFAQNRCVSVFFLFLAWPPPLLRCRAHRDLFPFQVEGCCCSFWWRAWRPPVRKLWHWKCCKQSIVATTPLSQSTLKNKWWSFGSTDVVWSAFIFKSLREGAPVRRRVFLSGHAKPNVAASLARFCHRASSCTSLGVHGAWPREILFLQIHRGFKHLLDTTTTLGSPW